MKFTDIMLDIETLGTGNEAAILSIGAVAFNADAEDEGSIFQLSPAALEALGEGFHGKVNLEATAPDKRGVITPSTVEWWFTQSDEARQAVLTGDRKPLGEVLQEFAAWIDRTPFEREVRLWSNGPTFDEIIVRSGFTRYGFRFPVSHRGSRCCRTMFELARSYGWQPNERPELREDILKHDALGDAVFQARGVSLQRTFLRSRILPAGTTLIPV